MARNKVVTAYLKAYKKAVGFEVLSEDGIGRSVTLSIPLHVSGNHRVEVTATEIASGHFVLSDMAHTLGELSECGKNITPDFRNRAEEIAKQQGANFVYDYLTLECRNATLGDSIQRFAEVCKTIGDAYLLHHANVARIPAILNDVRRIFQQRNLPFEERVKIPGELERHEFDIYTPPNGKPGVAVSVIAGHNTHALAKVWAFNCWDVKNAKQKSLLLGLVLDEEDSAPWTKGSRRILQKTADIVVPSSNLDHLEHALMFEGRV